MFTVYFRKPEIWAYCTWCPGRSSAAQSGASITHTKSTIYGSASRCSRTSWAAWPLQVREDIRRAGHRPGGEN